MESAFVGVRRLKYPSMRFFSWLRGEECIRNFERMGKNLKAWWHDE